MRILQVVPYYYPAWSFGGPPRIAYDLSVELGRRGHSVSCFTTNALDFRSNFQPAQKEHRLDKVKVNYFKNILRWDKVFITPDIVDAAKRRIREFDVVHLHEYRSFQNAVVAYYARRSKVPFVVQPHGSMITWTNDPLKLIFDVTVGHGILKNAAKLIALNEVESDHFSALNLLNKTEIVPNGVDLSRYARLPRRGGFRREYSIKDNVKLVLYVGRMHASKGLDLLVQAFGLIHNKNKDTRLVLIGPDDGYRLPLEQHLRNLNIEDDAIFTGFTSEEKKMAALVDCDVFVTPTFSGFPMSFLEASIAGAPIVTTRKGDKLEWMRHACLITKYSVDALSDSIQRLLDDEEYARELGQRASLAVRKLFDIRRVVDKIERLYEEIAVQESTSQERKDDLPRSNMEQHLKDKHSKELMERA